MPRLTAAYEKKDGKLNKLTAPGVSTRGGKFYMGAGGLAGTAEDYLRFCQMLLDGGVLDGKRLVSRNTIDRHYSAPTAVTAGPVPTGRSSGSIPRSK